MLIPNSQQFLTAGGLNILSWILLLSKLFSTLISVFYGVLEQVRLHNNFVRVKLCGQIGEGIGN